MRGTRQTGITLRDLIRFACRLQCGFYFATALAPYLGFWFRFTLDHCFKLTQIEDFCGPLPLLWGFIRAHKILDRFHAIFPFAAWYIGLQSFKKLSCLIAVTFVTPPVIKCVPVTSIIKALPVSHASLTIFPLWR